MGRDFIDIPKEMYTWAITRAGYSLDDFLQKNPRIGAYIEGERKPTVKQLEDFAKSVYVPVASLLLPSPPIETPPIPMFRRKTTTSRFNLNVYQTVLDVQGRQEWLSEYLVDNELNNCQFVGTYGATLPIRDMAVVIRRHLNLEIGWMFDLKSPEKAISLLVERMEDAGICVFFNGIVGNNTHRSIDVEECRGFALVTDTNAPMIFVNNKDSKTAQVFTLAHEFVHVLVGLSAGYAGIDGEYHNDDETYCDRVAAEFLVPATLLKDKWCGIDGSAKLFNVSRLVMARRAHDLHIISDDEYRSFYARYRCFMPNVKKSSGGAFYATVTRRVGRLFAFYVNSAVKSGQLSYTQAYRLTGLYGKTFDRFMSGMF